MRKALFWSLLSLLLLGSAVLYGILAAEEALELQAEQGFITGADILLGIVLFPIWMIGTAVIFGVLLEKVIKPYEK